MNCSQEENEGVTASATDSRSGGLVYRILSVGNDMAHGGPCAQHEVCHSG